MLQFHVWGLKLLSSFQNNQWFLYIQIGMISFNMNLHTPASKSVILKFRKYWTWILHVILKLVSEEMVHEALDTKKKWIQYIHLHPFIKFVIAIYHYLMKLLKLIQVKQDKEWGGIVCFDENLLNSKPALDMNNNHFVEADAFISVFKALPFGI